MTDSSPRPPEATPVILLGDQETGKYRVELAENAAARGYVVAEAFAFELGAARGTDDLTDVEVVVAAVGRAIAARMDIWVPFPGSDFVRELHLRRLSLVLQRHGLNLRASRELSPAPITGGISEIDFALRREVQAVDALDQAALAAEGARTLGQEIEQELAGTGGGTTPAAVAGPPCLPAPDMPWAQRKPMVERYAHWLVRDCGVTQAAAARVLNSTGQRTATGRQWQPGTVSKLLTGGCDKNRPGPAATAPGWASWPEPKPRTRP